MDIFTQGGGWEGNGRISEDHMVFNFRENGRGDHLSPTEYKRGGGGAYRKLTASQMPIIRWGNGYKNITTSPSPTMVQSLPLAHVIYVWGLRWSDTAKLCNSEDTSVTCWLHKQVHYAWF